MLSDIVRGLIGTLRGDDQQMYFKMLVFDMRQIEQNNLKKEAGKRPKLLDADREAGQLCLDEPAALFYEVKSLIVG